MKKQNLFFAIVMISFTSTFMSCQKEALLTSETKSDYEIPYNNNLNILKGTIDDHSNSIFAPNPVVSYEIPYNNELMIMKGNANDVEFVLNDAKTNNIPIKISQSVCLNGGVTLTAVHPTNADFDYADSNYKFNWIDNNGVAAEMNGTNSLSCVCSGNYQLQIIGKGNIIETINIEVKAQCTNDIPENL